MDGTSVKNHEKSVHLLEMCDVFLTFSDDFLKISIHPQHFGAFGQYPSSPKLKGAKNLFKKRKHRKSPTMFFQISLLLFGGFFNRQLVTKINHESMVCSNQQLWWNPPYLDPPRDPGGKGLPWPYSKRWWPPKRPCFFSAGFARFSAVWRKRSHEKKTPTFHYNWVVCNPLYTLNNQGVFHCSDVAIMQSISKKLIHGTLPSTIMKVKSKNLRYETHLPGTYYRLCMFVQR